MLSQELLQDHLSQVPPEAQRCLRLIQERVKRMTQLIDDLLAFSRLGRQPLQKRLVWPVELVKAAFEDLLHERQGRQAEIALADLPPCEADPALLQQVFANLLSNALKFTRSREVARIEIGYRPGTDPAVYFVADNGVGFDMRNADKLFGVFQRLHPVEEYEGTGVGLAIVQRIVIRHGGRVWASAKPGEGATFHFTLGSASTAD